MGKHFKRKRVKVKYSDSAVFRFFLRVSIPFALAVCAAAFVLLFAMLVIAVIVSAYGIMSAVAGAGLIIGVVDVISDLAPPALLLSGIGALSGGGALFFTVPLFGRSFFLLFHRAVGFYRLKLKNISED